MDAHHSFWTTNWIMQLKLIHNICSKTNSLAILVKLDLEITEKICIRLGAHLISNMLQAMLHKTGTMKSNITISILSKATILQSLLAILQRWSGNLQRKSALVTLLGDKMKDHMKGMQFMWLQIIPQLQMCVDITNKMFLDQSTNDSSKIKFMNLNIYKNIDSILQRFLMNIFFKFKLRFNL